MTTYTSEDSDPTVDNFDVWYKDSSSEDDTPSEKEESDFRFLKIHPVLVGIIEFILLLPMRIITFGAIVLVHFC